MPRQFGVPEGVVQAVMTGRLPPSAYSPYLSSIHNEHVVAVNNAYLLGDWVDVVFFGDYSWYLPHRSGLARFRNLKVSCAAKFEAIPYEGVKYLEKDPRHRVGINSDPTAVAWNNNSGTAAISLAYHFGVKRIALLGFDMSLDESQVSHWHGSHAHDKGIHPAVKRKMSSFDRHLRAFPAVAQDARRLGIEIINCSPQSAIAVFPKLSVQEFLGRDREEHFPEAVGESATAAK